MADIAEQLIVFLKTKSAITSLVGSSTSARILQQEAPKESSALPCICVTISGTNHVGYTAGMTDLAAVDITLTGWGSTISERNSLAAAVHGALSPLVKGNSLGSIPLVDISCSAGRSDGDVGAVDGSDIKAYVTQCTWRFWYYIS